MSDEQIGIFAAEPYDAEPARKRIVFDPGGGFVAACRADDRRARQRFKATLKASNANNANNSNAPPLRSPRSSQRSG